ncbi:MAG TPA: hypothetical protein VMR41_03650 [Patescibacteria group bacterium]|nr:hypothetical protein [Patescibacteria group bacterium]
MSSSKRTLGIIIIIVVVVVIAGIFLMQGNHKTAKPTQTAVKTTPVVLTPTLAAASPSAQATIPTQTAAQFNTMYKEAFVNECAALMGKQANSTCSCAADYMIGHYTENQLTQLAIQLRATRQLPAEIKTALNSCTTK